MLRCMCLVKRYIFDRADGLVWIEVEAQPNIFGHDAHVDGDMARSVSSLASLVGGRISSTEEGEVWWDEKEVELVEWR